MGYPRSIGAGPPFKVKETKGRTVTALGKHGDKRKREKRDGERIYLRAGTYVYITLEGRRPEGAGETLPDPQLPDVYRRTCLYHKAILSVQ